jgi:hypothetical protein
MLGGEALELEIAIPQYHWVSGAYQRFNGPGTIHGRAAWTRLRLAVSNARNPSWETSPPPSGVLLDGLSKYPRAEAVSLPSSELRRGGSDPKGLDRIALACALSRHTGHSPPRGGISARQSAPRPNCQIGKSGSGRRKGARTDRLLVGLTAVQFDEVDQHQAVRRLTIVLRLGKQGALVW